MIPAFEEVYSRNSGPLKTEYQLAVSRRNRYSEKEEVADPSDLMTQQGRKRPQVTRKSLSEP